MKGKLMLGVIVLVLALAVVPLSCSSTEEGGTSTPPGSGYIGPGSPAPPVGEINITLANLTLFGPGHPLELYLKRGEEVNLSILVRFHSYTPEVKQVSLRIDPTNSSCGCRWENYYGILDEEGNEIGEGCLRSEEVISYNMTGTVVIESGETLPLAMTVRIPEDLPKRISKSSFPVWVDGICMSSQEQHVEGTDWVGRIVVHIID